MKTECKECAVRKFYAKTFDIHFDEKDCWYNCPEKEKKERTEEDIKDLWDRISSY